MFFFTPTVVAALATNFTPIAVVTASAFLIGGLGALLRRAYLRLRGS